jgi:hypothetical protein
MAVRVLVVQSTDIRVRPDPVHAQQAVAMASRSLAKHVTMAIPPTVMAAPVRARSKPDTIATLGAFLTPVAPAQGLSAATERFRPLQKLVTMATPARATVVRPHASWNRALVALGHQARARQRAEMRDLRARKAATTAIPPTETAATAAASSRTTLQCVPVPARPAEWMRFALRAFAQPPTTSAVFLTAVPQALRHSVAAAQSARAASVSRLADARRTPTATRQRNGAISPHSHVTQSSPTMRRCPRILVTELRLR